MGNGVQGEFALRSIFILVRLKGIALMPILAKSGAYRLQNVTEYHVQSSQR